MFIYLEKKKSSTADFLDVTSYLRTANNSINSVNYDHL